jgi:hypothetical protein
MAEIKSGTLRPDWENVALPDIDMLLGRRAFPLDWFRKGSGPKAGSRPPDYEKENDD